MSPLRHGRVDLKMPIRYKTPDRDYYLYKHSTRNKCASTCMRVTSSKLDWETLKIEYDNMLTSCLSNSEIVIRCQEFLNPIRPEVLSGFQLKIYGNKNAPDILE